MVLRALMPAFLLAGVVHAQNHASEVSELPANPAAAAPQSPSFVNCPGGGPLGAVDLSVQAGDRPLPFRTINHLSEGDTVRYAPILRGKEKRPGEVALVLIPATREQGQENIVVTEPRPADKAQE